MESKRTKQSYAPLIGAIGEHYVCIDLLRQRKDVTYAGVLNGNKLADILFEHEGELVRMEVKTSVYGRERFKLSNGDKVSGWSFARLQQSIADVLVFVLLEEDWSLYKILYAKKADISGTNMNYRRPHKDDKAGKRGPARKESSRDYLYEDVRNVLFN